MLSQPCSRPSEHLPVPSAISLSRFCPPMLHGSFYTYPRFQCKANRGVCQYRFWGILASGSMFFWFYAALTSSLVIVGVNASLPLTVMGDSSLKSTLFRTFREDPAWVVSLAWSFHLFIRGSWGGGSGFWKFFLSFFPPPRPARPPAPCLSALHLLIRGNREDGS